MGILDSLGNGIDDIWQYLINDPTKPAGGILQQALNPQAAVAASTKTPLGAPSQAPGAPPPAAPAASLLSYFKPHSGILGNSPLAAALSGGLAGLGSSTGYTGLAAVGQGFGGGTHAAQERHMNQMQAIGAGQQYQQGQQQMQLGQQNLAQGNLQIAQAIRNYNLWNQYTNPGAPPVTYADVQDPQKLAQVMSAPPNQGGGAASSGVATGAGAAPGQSPTTTSPGMTPGAGSAPANGTVSQIAQAIFQQESGNNPNAPTSVNGAVGPGQVMPSTFKQYARPGEDINNPQDNAAVSRRIISDLSLRTGGDPARIAVGYFSGPGNVAPPGSPTPWVHNTSDGNGTTVAQYVDQVTNRLNQGQPTTQDPQLAQAQPQGQPQAQPGDDLATAFAQMHGGMTPTQWAQLGMQMQNPGMVAEAEKYNPQIIYGTKALETQAVQANTPHELRAGAQLTDNQGKPIGRGIPTPVKIYDQKSGNYVSGYRYPSGELVIGNEANGQPATESLGPGNEKLQEGYATRRTEMGDAINSGIAGEQQALAMATALKATQSGTWATDFGHIKAGLQSAGLGDLADTLLPNTDAAAVQMATKDALQGVFSSMKPLLGPRIAAQEVNLYAKASANPDLLPAANAKMISMMVGGLRYKRDLYHELSSQPGNVDPNDFEIQFQKDHPLQSYINDAEKEIGPLKGMEKTAQSNGAPDPLFRGLTDLHADKTGKQIGWDGKNWIDPKAKQKWDGFKWQPLQ